MKKIIYFLICLTCSHALSSCAQGNLPVVRAKAFYVIPTPGTIAVDEKGQELRPARDSVFTVYIETKENTITWEQAWMNGRSFSIIPVQNHRAEVEVGQAKMGRGKIVLSPQNGNTLWQLELSDDLKHEKAPQNLAAGEVLLKGKWKNKPFFYKVKSLTELASPEYQ